MGRIQISICDDEDIVHELITPVIRRHYENRFTGLEILHYYDATSILDEAYRQQIVLMDIAMPGVDGIDAATRLYHENSECAVIMLTERNDRVKDAFKAHAIRFVTKPIMCGELFEALDYAIASRKEYADLVVWAHGKSLRINQKDVIMLESHRNNVIVYLDGKAISLNTPTKTLEKMLEPSLFLRVHKSYIVNMHHVKEINGRFLLLTDGLHASVSVRRAREIVARLRAFDLGGDSLCM